ncbi:MAG: serine/threonine-protein kinase, partial [Desulfurococcaceae archaeon]
MSGQNDSLKNIVLEMKNKISGSTTLFQLLILLDYYLKKLEEHGCSEDCIERNIREVEEVARELKRLSSCRLDLLDRVIKRDPRLTTINKHLRLIIELLQRECGQQTYFSSVIAQEAQETKAIEYEKVKPMIERKNVVGKYEILKVLGEGGMGIVWLARDLSESKIVAIKAPKITGTPLRDEINIKRVIIEATILRNLDHPNIVKFIDYFVEGQKPYLVMEYVEGDHLEKYADLVSGDEKSLIEFAKKLTDAVDHMHERNVVHRDIKPKNIYVTPTTPWDIKLLDFGTAKYFHSQLERGEAIFSPGGYTAPEQLKFMYSPQSDIWSIG